MRGKMAKYLESTYSFFVPREPPSNFFHSILVGVEEGVVFRTPRTKIEPLDEMEERSPKVGWIRRLTGDG